LQTRREIVMTVSEKKASQSQEERAKAVEKEKGEAAIAQEEERQQAEVRRLVAGTVAP
jgi:hypothetical protein